MSASLVTAASLSFLVSVKLMPACQPAGRKLMLHSAISLSGLLSMQLSLELPQGL